MSRPFDAPQRLSHRPVETEAFGEAHDRQAIAHILVGVPHHGTDRNPQRCGHRHHAADHFAFEALCIEMTLTGDDQICADHLVVQVDFVCDEVEAGHQSSAQRCKSASQSTCGACPCDGRHVNAVLFAVHLCQALESSGQQSDLGGRGALLWPEDGGSVGEAGGDVAGNEQFDTSKSVRCMNRSNRPQTAVRSGRPAETDDDPFGAGIEGLVDQFARADRRGGHRIVALAPADERKARRPCHFDHCGGTVQTPSGRNGVTQGTHHHRTSIRAAERIECSVAPVSDGYLGAVVAEFPTRVTNRSRNLRSGDRSLELVDCRQNAHRPGVYDHAKIRPDR